MSLPAPPPVDPRALRDAAGTFPTGVTVVTLRAEGRDHGMTASAFSSLSLDPPLLLVCVARRAATHDLLQGAGGFAVHVLAADQEELSDRFAHRIRTADGYAPWPAERDKFEGLAAGRSARTGAPLLAGCQASLDCTLHEVLPGGDHSVFVGRVVGIEGADRPREPLIFWQGRYARLAVGPAERARGGR